MHHFNYYEEFKNLICSNKINLKYKRNLTTFL